MSANHSAKPFLGVVNEDRGNIGQAIDGRLEMNSLEFERLLILDDGKTFPKLGRNKCSGECPSSVKEKAFTPGARRARNGSGT